MKKCFFDTFLVTGASVREPRAAYPEPYHHYNHHPHRVFENFQHYDSIHCRPHYGHFDCHVDHYDIYGGHGGHSGQGGYDGYDGGYGPHHYQGQNPGQKLYTTNNNSYADLSTESFQIKMLFHYVSWFNVEHIHIALI